MAKQTGNVVTHGLSGKVGGLLVFRQRAGKTVVSKVPQMPKEASEKQIANRKRFQRAVIYARSAMTDTDLKAAYQAQATKGLTPYNVAVADFFNAPDIDTVDLSGYTGQPGDLIRITVSDDFLVKEVKVTIINGDGSLVESGDAHPDSLGLVWTYTAVQINEHLDGDRITISATDIPGNITEEEQTL